jgi:hypothetical protein
MLGTMSGDWKSLVLIVMLLAACQFQSITPTVTPSTVQKLELTVPAGLTTAFYLEIDYNSLTVAEPVAWQIDAVPQGIDTEFPGFTTPWERTLLVTPDAALVPGSYLIQAAAVPTNDPPIRFDLTLHVIPCTETDPGEFTRDLQSNLVTLITAGKPSMERGLLVPIQVCEIPQRVHVTLTDLVMSEAGVEMMKPPSFYLYRSRAWPAPSFIYAHGVPAYFNVDLSRTQSAAWELTAELDRPGLYLLIFERDRYLSSTNPRDIPASVTYRLW